MTIQSFTPEQARELARKSICSTPYEESDLLWAFSGIKRASENGQMEVSWIIFAEDGNIYDSEYGNFSLDFVVRELRKLGYTAYTERRNLIVKWSE